MARNKMVRSKVRGNSRFWLVFVCFTLAVVVSVSGVTLAAGSASGLVFRDYNENGTQDANEPGVSGVTITAFDDTGLSVGTATSSAVQATRGQFTITWTGPDTRVRLEFHDLPGVEQQGAFGAGSGTSVQFVDAGANAVRYGINRPSDYCLASPNLQIITTCFKLGAQTTGEGSVVSHNYDGSGGINDLATDIQVGPVWGLAYKRDTDTIFASAFAKRQAEYGPGGSGQIYAISGAGVVTQFATIPNAGATGHTLPYAQDSSFYDAPGKQSLGDMDISEDGTTLWVINLNDRQLYSVDSTSGVVQARGVIGAPACAGGVYRPFGLGVRDNLVYVGGVCTNESSALGTTAGLDAYVFSYNPAGGAVTQVLNFPLNYPRGCADIFNGYLVDGAALTCRTATQGSAAEWQPWTATWPSPNLSVANGGSGTGLSGNLANPAEDKFFAYAQPLVAGIEFVNDDMIISIRDRTGDQLGYQDNGPDGLGGAFPDTLVTITAGDILRASPNGVGGWTLENNAQSVPAGSFGPSAGANNEQGPGSGEFYVGDNFGASHDETITGGIVQVPGANELAAAAMDPGTLFSAGTIWYDDTSGANNRQYTIVAATAPFGKGNGLGDLTALCAAAPIEIGNYVWFDADQDGVQDPGEQPLPGIILTLTDSLGNPVLFGGNPVTATTDAQGRYIFSSDTSRPTTTASFIYSVPLLENTAYQVRIDTTQPNLASYTTTLANFNDGVGDTRDDIRDSDGVQTGNFAIASVTTGTAGQNDHTFDFGFFTLSYNLGNRVWFDDGRGGGGFDNGIQDGTEIGIDNVTVNLINNLGTVIATTTTAGGGYYRFDNLLPGSYVVEIPASNFAAGGALEGLRSSTDAATSGTPNNDVDRDDNGVNAVAGGVRSNPVQLGPPGPAEPTGTTDLGPGDNTALLPAGRSNLTMDFGFIGTPVIPPGTPSAGGGTPPSPIRLDPAIVKLVDPAFALPGEDVNWTIVVTNPHSVPINNVSFTDNFPSQLEIISASADNNVGSLVVTGNSVTYSIVVINPGQSVRVSVLTRIRPGTPVPFIITNTVSLTGAYVGSASATVLSVGSLPATGFEPAWRKPLLISAGVIVLVVSVSVGAWYIQRRPHGSE